jgi:abortive infection bacteriophage resistance protein
MKRSREKFVDHFQSKYSDKHTHLPLWMAVEILPFGAMLKLFSGMNDSLKKTIAKDYKIPDLVLNSWLIAINVVRNICAHHGRLWNKELGYQPLLPKERKYPEWHFPVKITQNRIFGILTILKYMISIISPECTWHNRVKKLLDEYPQISKKSMGFPDIWDQSPLWK